MKKLLLGLLLSSSVLVQAAKPVATAINAHLKNFVGAEAQVLNDASNAAEAVAGEPAVAEQLSELKKREIISSLFFSNSYSKLHQANCSDVISDNLASDLNLFTVCDGESANLFSKLNYTQTLFGELHLIHDLLTPTTNRAQLSQNQALVKSLVENPAAVAKIEHALKIVNANQEQFLKLWLDDKESVANLFYKNRFLKHANGSTIATAVANTLNVVGDWTLAHAYELPNVIVKNKATLDKNDLLPSMANKVGSVAKDFMTYNLNPKNLAWTPCVEAKDMFGSAKTEEFLSNIEQVYRSNDKTLEASARTKFKYGYYGLATYAIAVNAYIAYQKYIFYKARYDRAKVVNELQAQLVAVSKMIKSLDIIRAVFKKELGVELAPITLSSEAQELVNDLHKATFDSASILYFEGRVLKCYHQIKAIKEQLADLFGQIGYVDSYLSAAKLYNSRANQKAQFCFVDYLASQTPTVRGINYWNIMVDPAKVVVNNLLADKNVVLTGANAGGKSTTIKAIIQNILLGQTFGIAAAKEFELTPFTKLITYLNITDDLSNGKSLFKAEVERAQVLVATINGLAAQEFAFCAIDELFTGTAADAGAACAEELVIKFKAKTNATFIFATHYQNLTKLAVTSPDNFANYCMLPPTKVNGKLVYPFVIDQGINVTNVAKDILAEANLI